MRNAHFLLDERGKKLLILQIKQMSTFYEENIYIKYITSEKYVYAKILTLRRICMRPNHGSSGINKCHRETCSTCMHIWLLNQAFHLENPLLESPLSNNNKRTSFSDECPSSPKSEPELICTMTATISFQETVAGIYSGEVLPLQLSLICLTSSEMWFVCLSPKVVFSKNHSKTIIGKLCLW